MAHYAYIDSDNLVVSVIVGKEENTLIDGLDPEIYYAQGTPYNVKRTSYNTQGAIHLLGGSPYRKNYAGIGYTYDADRDAFIPPKPFASWLLNEKSCLWESPVPMPTTAGMWTWDEETQTWTD
jgi:hypothetical protein